MEANSTPISIRSSIWKAEGISGKHLDGDLILFSTGGQAYYGLNDVATEVWEMISGKTDVKSIVDALVLRYRISEDQCLLDILALLNHLRQHGLIHSEPIARGIEGS